MRDARAYRTLFILGSPRSGTTWIQLLLARHPAVVTAPETHIFSFYIDRFRGQWREEHESAGTAERGKAGLSELLSDEEFGDLCRLNARAVLDKIAARRPGADLVVEKSPAHALHAAFIRRLFPEAYFLHVVRDPRDTVASLLAAGRSWGRGWAPRNVIDAARLWSRHVERARALEGRTGRYRALRYEALRADPAEQLHALLEWLDLPLDRSRCEAIAEEHSLARLRRREGDGRRTELPTPGERLPHGFFRRGAVGAWRDDLSRGEARLVEHVCGGVMAELGYERAFRGGGPPPARLLAHDAIRRVRESVDWQLQRLLTKV